MKIYDQNIWGNYAVGQCIANRSLLLLELIEEQKPDFCCFQECNPATSRSGKTPIQSLLHPTYAEVAPTCAERNFTPVFYNAQKFHMLDSGFFVFEGRNDVDSKSAAWGIFEEKSGSERVGVMSTHFWWKFDEPEDERQRVQNASAVAETARNLFEKYACPLFVCGDLNSGLTPQGTGGYDKMIAEGFQDVRFLASETSRAHTCATSYPVLENGKYTAGDAPCQTIDYILAYGTNLPPLRRFSILDTPSSRASSDHLPLILEF